MIVVHGEVCQENMEWLNRSIVGEVLVPTDCEYIFSKIEIDWRSKVKIRAMGEYKFLVTFHSREEAEEVLSLEKNFLSSILNEIRKWTPQDVCQTRRIWLECQGLPLHGWSKLNITKISDIWGKVIRIDFPKGELEDFSFARIMIDTACYSFINNWICFALDGIVYDVHVKEIEKNADNSGIKRKVNNTALQHSGRKDGELEVEKSQNDEEGDLNLNDENMHENQLLIHDFQGVTAKNINEALASIEQNVNTPMASLSNSLRTDNFCHANIKNKSGHH